MNTNNVYCAKILRIVHEDFYGSFLNKSITCAFTRETLVYQKSNGKFYDLLGKKCLKCGCDYFDDVGTEFISAKHLIPFNAVVNQTKGNLPKCKIKKLYMEHKK